MLVGEQERGNVGNEDRERSSIMEREKVKCDAENTGELTRLR